MNRLELERMTHDMVFALIKEYGDCVSFPEPKHIEYMLSSYGINRKINGSSWIYKLCAIQWETSYTAIKEN